jgi:Fe-S-cluster-containing hydrogenase component 2
MADNHARPELHGFADAPVSFAQTACLAAQRPDRPCVSCESACPENAIRIKGRDVAIRQMSCSGCGICAKACPTGAITVAGYAARAPRLECSRVPKPNGAIVPCLGGVGADTLREPLVGGDVTLLAHGWCAECPTAGHQAAPWADAVTIANDEMAKLGLPQRVHVETSRVARWRARPAPRPATDNPARRVLFNRLAAGSTGRATHPGSPDKAQTPGPERRLAALTRLSGGEPAPRSLFPAFRLKASTGDLAATARLCPTHALSAHETPTSLALIFDPAACISCGACEESGALEPVEVTEGVFTGPETLATEPRATCTRCRMRFTPRTGEATCGACARDTDLAALAHGLMRPRPNYDTTL